ncbi:hypothetical protein [uncultured Microscilla sp.]|uniref:hypothetical protein n=1 Tax=uncultured Microscilla sp. TaxID=432653 RepID=UPI0026090F61|nr:hypothetical protein [uncultured Microscilla sp.]
MNAIKYEKWESFRRLVLSYFNHLGRAGDIELLREPNAQQLYALRAYQTPEGSFIKKMTWDSGKDFQNFQQANLSGQMNLHDFAPTITTQTYLLAPDSFRELNEHTQGLAFTMPLPPKPELIIRDGTYHELRLHHYSGHISLKWHSDLPEEWYMLQPVIDKFQALDIEFFV